MKKLSILALLVITGVTGSMAFSGSASFVKTQSKLWSGNSPIIWGTRICDLDKWKDVFANMCDKIPDVNVPETETSMPETETSMPETETSMPETETSMPETETSIPEIETSMPETETSMPETETSMPETETSIPETETNVPETGAVSFAEQVVELVNAERTKAGLNPLILDNKIASAALIRAKEIEISFSHTRPNGGSFSTVLKDNGISFRGAGENIAWGQRSPEEVMRGWMNSDGHRANILNPRFTKIGVGYYQNSAGRNYWTQLFTY